MIKKVMLSILIVLFALGAACRAPSFSQRELDIRYPLIPKPLELVPRRTEFHLSPDTPLVAEGEREEEMGGIIAYFSRLVCGTDAPQSTGGMTGFEGKEKVVFVLEDGEQSFGAEGYELDISSKRLLFKASTPAGLFYAVQSLRQLLPRDFESDKGGYRDEGWLVPGARIRDIPRYRWRGAMLDVCRHFFSKDFIKKMMDEIAMYKLNTLHLHLTDDQGWRLEIKRYPGLTETGAWRKDMEDLHWNARKSGDGKGEERYGGYYSQEDIRELLAYAESRYITIVPEIEMPAHSVAALASYPELSCTGGPFSVLSGGYWPITDIYCGGKEEVFSFLENVLDEVIRLFPGRYIHIGGDEADKTNWRACPDCQSRIEAEGLKDEAELQSYFIKRIETFVNTRDRRIIGWDEILEGGLAPRATVMSWRGTEGGIEAAKAGHDVVMSPTSHCYIDYFQGRPDGEPLAIGGFLPLERVYSFEPTPVDLSAAEAEHILGAQVNLWTEYVATPEHAEYMLFPRLLALAEVVWSPKEIKDFSSFVRRLLPHFYRLESLGINYARSLFDIEDTSRFNAVRRELEISLQTQFPGGTIRFTRDGGPPTDQSSVYRSPIIIPKTATISAGLFDEGRLLGKIFAKEYVIHDGANCPVGLLFPYEEDYDGGTPNALTDCIRGSKNSRDGHWQGFLGRDLEAVVDLGEVKRINRLKAGFLLDITRSVFLPESVAFSLSTDGLSFEEIAVRQSAVSLRMPAIVVEDFEVETGGLEARFIKVRAKNIGTCPGWHVAAGKKSWLFADEITVQ